MVTINKINLKQNPDVQKKFLKKISIVLQKIGSSHKTKAIHKLVAQEALYLGYGITDISKTKTVQYGAPYISGNKLSGLAADLTQVVDKADLQEMSKKVKDIEKANKELSRVKSTITDTSAIQLKTLDKSIAEMFDDLIEGIDYFALVDVYYYLFVNVLSSIGLKGNGKNKIFESSYAVFKAIVVKILNKTHVKVEGENKQKMDIVLDYIFARNFTEQSAQTVLAKLSRLYGSEEIAFLQDIKPNDYKEFRNAATLLTKAGICNITESAFMAEFTTLVGEGSKAAMSGTFDEMIAYIISANYKSSLFDAPNISRDDQERLEQLILNFKKDLVIKA